MLVASLVDNLWFLPSSLLPRAIIVVKIAGAYGYDVKNNELYCVVAVIAGADGYDV